MTTIATRAEPASPRDLRGPPCHSLGPSALALAGSEASREGLGTRLGFPIESSLIEDGARLW
jgi:hypothetical protein